MSGIFISYFVLASLISFYEHHVLYKFPSILGSFIAYIISFIFLNIMVLPDLLELISTTRKRDLPKIVKIFLQRILYGFIVPFVVGGILLGCLFMCYLVVLFFTDLLTS